MPRGSGGADHQRRHGATPSRLPGLGNITSEHVDCRGARHRRLAGEARVSTLLFLNGHGGNIATLAAAFSEIYSARSLAVEATNRPPVKCRLKNWWQNKEVLELAKQLYGEAEGSHATPSEVALTQFTYPDAIKSAATRRSRRAATLLTPPITAASFRTAESGRIRH